MKQQKQENRSAKLFDRFNYYLIGIGLIFIISGFLIMSGGRTNDPNVFNAEELFSFTRISLSTIFLIIGYTLEVIGILYKQKDELD